MVWLNSLKMVHIVEQQHSLQAGHRLGGEGGAMPRGGTFREGGTFGEKKEQQMVFQPEVWFRF